MDRDRRDANRDPKKTGHIQIRVPPETKQEFLAACEEDRVSASDVLRRAIVDYLAARKQSAAEAGRNFVAMIPRPLRKRRYLAAAAGLAGLAFATTMPSAADPDFAAAFKRLDLNHDGVLTEEEFALRGQAAQRYATPVDTSNGFQIYNTPLGPVERSDPARLSARAKSAPLTAMIFARVPSDGVYMIGRMDGNRDRAVSASELELALRQRVEASFSNWDSSHDGMLDARELDAMFAAQPPRPGAKPNPVAAAQMQRMRDIEHAEYLDYDANGDGSLTQAEVLEARLAAMIAAYAPPP